MHLDDEHLQRLLHGELSSDGGKAGWRHLAACDDCARRFAVMEKEEATVGRLLLELDRPAPRVDVGAIARRAEAARPSPRPLQWAAGFALVFGLAGVAYAIPGSPVRGWVDSMVQLISGRPNPLAPSGATLDSPGSTSGIAVAPGENFLIQFTSPTAKGEVLVTLTDRADIEIRASRGAARFTSGADRLVVEPVADGGAFTYEVQIPHAAPRVEIRVGEERVFLKEGSRITSMAGPGSSGPYRLPLSPAIP